MVLGVPRTLLLGHVRLVFDEWWVRGDENSLGIDQVIDMVAHRHEQVEEDFPPDETVSQILRYRD
jgi:hypothetical protein